MICIKFDQKIKKNLKNLNCGLSSILGFFNLKNFEAIFQPWSALCMLHGRSVVRLHAQSITA